MVPYGSMFCARSQSFFIFFSKPSSPILDGWRIAFTVSRPGDDPKCLTIDKSPNPIMDGIKFLCYLVCFNGKSRILKWRYVSTIFWAIFCS